MLGSLEVCTCLKRFHIAWVGFGIRCDSAKVVVSPNNKLIASGGQESHVTEADGLCPLWLGGWDISQLFFPQIALAIYRGSYFRNRCEGSEISSIRFGGACRAGCRRMCFFLR